MSSTLYILSNNIVSKNVLYTTYIVSKSAMFDENAMIFMKIDYVPDCFSAAALGSRCGRCVCKAVGAPLAQTSERHGERVYKTLCDTI